MFFATFILRQILIATKDSDKYIIGELNILKYVNDTFKIANCIFSDFKQMIKLVNHGRRAFNRHFSNEVFKECSQALLIINWTFTVVSSSQSNLFTGICEEQVRNFESHVITTRMKIQCSQTVARSPIDAKLGINSISLIGSRCEKSL